MSDRIFGFYITTEPPETDCYRIIVLRYPNGVIHYLIYDVEPVDPNELRELMWQLQHAAYSVGFTVTVTDETGNTEEAEALP